MFARMRIAVYCALAGLLGVNAASAGGPPDIIPPKIIPPKIILPKKGIPPVIDPILKVPVKLHHYHVEYRCPLPRTKTFTNHAQAHAFENKLKDLGFRTTFTHHGTHYHVRYELDNWRQRVLAGPAGHAQAHALENFLKSIGCQTKLVHH